MGPECPIALNFHLIDEVLTLEFLKNFVTQCTDNPNKTIISISFVKFGISPHLMPIIRILSRMFPIDQYSHTMSQESGIWLLSKSFTYYLIIITIKCLFVYFIYCHPFDPIDSINDSLWQITPWFAV